MYVDHNQSIIIDRGTSGARNNKAFMCACERGVITHTGFSPRVAGRHSFMIPSAHVRTYRITELHKHTIARSKKPTTSYVVENI